MSNFVSGRHFLQTPGPTNLPERVLQRDGPQRPSTIAARSSARWGAQVVAEAAAGLPAPTKTTVGIFPASGTGAWEAALVNTLVPWRPHPDQPHRTILPPLGADGPATSASMW